MKNFNKTKKTIIMLVAFFTLLTSLPHLYKVDAEPTTIPGEENCYGGVCFEGEVEGNNLISYQSIVDKFNEKTNQTKTIISFENNKTSHKEIYNQYTEELSKGGMWLKFTDKKYTRNGKSRTFYVAKKPILNNISWNDLYKAGMVYGWDVIDKDGKIIPGKDSYQDYSPTIITIDNKKYIVRLLRGASNYNDSVKYKSGTRNIYTMENASNSEWNRTIVASTKQYRGVDDSMEPELKEGNTSYKYVTSNYKNQIAGYNWFGDLTLGAWGTFYYNDKSLNSIRGLGQRNWTQEFADSPEKRSYRGNSSVDYGAAGSNSLYPNNTSGEMGFRPVLEPYNPLGEVQTKQTIKLKKADPEGNPLSGVKFILNGDTYTTDSEGNVEIPVWKYPPGQLTLEEPEQTINGIKYSSKKISINHKLSNCYDGVCFEGEVEGNSLISYNSLINDHLGEKVPELKNKKISGNAIDNAKGEGAAEIRANYKDELSKGGIWLKFTDKKYTRNGKPRIFYVAKKPILKGTSWNELHSAGVIYGWDVIDPNTGDPKSSLDKDKYKNTYNNKDYKATIVEINGEKYIVRLLQGKTNYGGDVSNTKVRKYNEDNTNSEWNRVILPITKGYRFGSSTNSSSYS